MLCFGAAGICAYYANQEKSETRSENSALHARYWLLAAASFNMFVEGIQGCIPRRFYSLIAFYGPISAIAGITALVLWSSAKDYTMCSTAIGIFAGTCIPRVAKVIALIWWFLWRNT